MNIQDYHPGFIRRWLIRLLIYPLAKASYKALRSKKSYYKYLWLALPNWRYYYSPKTTKYDKHVSGLKNRIKIYKLNFQ